MFSLFVCIGCSKELGGGIFVKFRLHCAFWSKDLFSILERVCSKFCRFLQFSSVLVYAILLAGDAFDDLVYCVKLR